MWSSFVCSLLWLGFLHAEVKEENSVLILTKDNFDQAVNDHEFILIKFYAPWCGHCKSLAPEYEKAAQMLKDEGSKIKLAKVDATVESELAGKYQITGYPTLKFFRSQKPMEYGGARSAESITAWCKKKVEPPLRILDTLESITQLIDSHHIVVIGFLGDNSDAESELEKIANEFDDVVFGVTKLPEAHKTYEVTKSPRIVLFKKFDEKRVDFDGEMEKLSHFIRVESVSLVSEFSQKTASVVFSSPITEHLVVFMSKENDFQKHESGFTSVAKKFKGKLHLMVVDIDNEEHQRVLEFFGLQKSDAPTYCFIKLSEEALKFRPDSSDLSASAMSAAAQKFLDGELKQFLMSEAIPETQTGPVTVLVGKTFNQITKDPSKSVFVMLYAPWCGHCKNLSPVWEELAKTYEGSENVVIAKMDATLNEAEDLKVSSFPTLKYYPKNSDKVVDYSGDRTLDALKAFVESDGKTVPATGKSDTEEAADEDADEDHARDEL